MEDASDQPVPGDGLSGFLEPHEISGGCGVDIALVRRAVKERWPMDQNVRNLIMARLGTIVERQTVQIPSGTGIPFDSEAVADRNAINAAALLKAMMEEDRSYAMKAAGHIQAERHHAEGSKVQTASEVRIIVQDASGQTRRVGSLRELYANYPAALPAPDSPPAGPEQA